MKKLFLFLGWAFIASLLLSPAPAGAISTQATFQISVDIPAATSIGIVANQIDTVSGVWTKVPSSNLSFGMQTLNSALGIYTGTKYFAVDIAPVGSTANMQVGVSYQEGSNPNGTGHGLGWKGTATFVKTSGSGNNTTDQLLTNHGKKLFKDLNNETITSAEILGGWSRVYLGLNTGDPNATPPEPAQAELFTPLDKPGNYNGTILITATAD